MNVPMFDTKWASHSIRRYTRYRGGAHADTRSRWRVAGVVGAGSLVRWPRTFTGSADTLR